MQVHIPSISYVESVWKKIQQNFVNCHFIIKCPFDFPVLGQCHDFKISCILGPPSAPWGPCRFRSDDAEKMSLYSPFLKIFKWT